ncbi:MAG TPA: hypothetical protein VNC61_01155 [Acidimicrobiales bacterium]|nr:hypothetical protein [Acidimicrobiales bacterium]
MLSNADLPASLGLKQNNSDAAQNLAKVFNQTYPGCVGHYAVFTLQGRSPSPVLTGKTIYPQVFSESATCGSSAKAQSVFAEVSKKVTKFGASSVSGIGDSAFLARSKSKTANSYVIFWRDGAVLASVQLSGPVGNKKISVAETKLLARRQVGHR